MSALTLTRREGEVVLIDEGRIRIRVEEARAGRAKLIVTAAASVAVDRLEVVQRRMQAGRKGRLSTPALAKVPALFC